MTVTVTINKPEVHTFNSIKEAKSFLASIYGPESDVSIVSDIDYIMSIDNDLIHSYGYIEGNTITLSCE